MKNSEEPVTPMPYTSPDGTIQFDVYFGLTKREYFAGSAMQGLIATWYMDPKHCAELAIQIADELLKQLEK